LLAVSIEIGLHTTAPPPQAEISSAKTQAETEIVEHSQPRLRSTLTDHHAEIEIGANPSPFPTVNHHATTKSTEERGELWRTDNRGESTEKEKKKP
jgi:hypothetical protein